MDEAPLLAIRSATLQMETRAVHMTVPLQVMPYSTGCTTTLSNFEAGQNYKDVDDPAVTVSHQHSYSFSLRSIWSQCAGALMLAWCVRLRPVLNMIRSSVVSSMLYSLSWALPCFLTVPAHMLCCCVN